jgi:hypothetical protein
MFSAQERQMTMGRKERIQVGAMLQQKYVESDKPTQANMAVFYDERDQIVYAGIITNWPMIGTGCDQGTVRWKNSEVLLAIYRELAILLSPVFSRRGCYAQV